ncbi:MAG: hypothetical protein IPL26_13040 [Leptospiraceae bacterium]|nr:hypothetical protein [Leptospiraceae bacterium]
MAVDTDKPLLDLVDRQIKILSRLLSGSIADLQKELDTVIAANTELLKTNPDMEPISTAALTKSQARVKKLLNQIEFILTNYTKPAIKSGYQSGQDIVEQLLRDVDPLGQSFDKRAVNVLIKDMASDYTTGINGARKNIDVFFKLSKQLQATESQLSEAVSKGLIKKGTIPSSKKELIKVFNKLYGEGNVIPIKTVNGKIRNYKIDTYSEMVARSRVGRAQVEGTLQEAANYNVSTFRVSVHNTDTPVCIPHEGEIYTTDTANKKFEFLTAENKPLYHPNCQHRLLPKPFTKRALAEMKDVR